MHALTLSISPAGTAYRTTTLTTAGARLRGKVHGSKRRQLGDADAEIAEMLWRKVQAALVTAGHNVVVLPERRTGSRDWVNEGLHIPRCDTRQPITLACIGRGPLFSGLPDMELQGQQWVGSTICSGARLCICCLDGTSLGHGRQAVMVVHASVCIEATNVPACSLGRCGGTVLHACYAHRAQVSQSSSFAMLSAYIVHPAQASHSNLQC